MPFGAELAALRDELVAHAKQLRARNDEETGEREASLLARLLHEQDARKVRPRARRC